MKQDKDLERDVFMSELRKKETEHDAAIIELQKLETGNEEYRKRITQLEEEVKSLSKHSNFKQKIQHVVQVKEENNFLRKVSFN